MSADDVLEELSDDQLRKTLFDRERKKGLDPVEINEQVLGDAAYRELRRGQIGKAVSDYCWHVFGKIL